MIFRELKAISQGEDKVLTEEALFSFWLALKNQKPQVVSIAMIVHLFTRFQRILDQLRSCIY
jgi:hypothetical protein